MDDWPGHLTRYSARTLARVTGTVGLDASWWTGALQWRLQRMHDRLTFPDRGIWRLPAVCRLAHSLNRRHRFDAVFTSGMPFSDHLTGLALQSLLRRPWLADFRDPWVEYIHWRQWQTGRGGGLTRAAETAVVRRAARVISVNRHMTRRFVTRYRRVPTGKFVTIENGFDTADFKIGDVERSSTHFRMLYAGSLYKTRSPQVILEAYRRFVEGVPGSRSRAQFDFAGRLGPHADEVAGSGRQGGVRYLGLLPHADALRRMAAADVNVILLPDVPGSENDTTAKVYECLGSGRAVLAAVPLDGAAAAVLRQFDGVRLCSPNDVEGLTRAMAELFQAWSSGALQANHPPRALHDFTREARAKQLAACLDDAVSMRRRVEGQAR